MVTSFIKSSSINFFSGTVNERWRIFHLAEFPSLQRHLSRALRDVLGCTGDFDHSSLGNVNGIEKLSEMRMNK